MWLQGITNILFTTKQNIGGDYIREQSYKAPNKQ